MKEVIKIYKEENGKIIDQTVDVSLVSYYYEKGWTTEKPKKDNEKPIIKKSIKKESSK